MSTEKKKKPVIYVDIDNTICTQDGQNYENAKPMYDRISKMNDYIIEDGMLCTGRQEEPQLVKSGEN